ncbi:chaperone dnaJ [Chlorella sorokiniana]|uniref:Chaperone dnaJ n=1 Tax=Chlorella sorokiniana TaxID=3076 RepID=A0A2P6TTB6_CHLSO|nr:chaperone dnaJ [Chlorella sorokiniana]|eukprot:PRW57310.1 chaperone dnaJ [Chlorella sorokiniana]
MSTLTSAACRQCCAGQRGLQQRHQQALAAPRRRPSRSPQPAAVCFSSLDGGAGAAGLVAQGVAWAAVAFMASQLFFQQQSEPEDGPPQRECESCGGSGVVPCWCNRWSDGDGGCSTCQGSGRMICSSCRGGGTAVPIQAKIYIDNQRTDNFRQNH